MPNTIMSLAADTSPRAATWRRLASACAIAAPLVFLASLIGFAAARDDGYSHGTKAVSELGVVGAPYALAFNLLGFMLPGLLILVAAVSLAYAQPRRSGMLALALAGGAFAMAGAFPFDMANPGAVSSQAHIGGAMLAGLFWAIAAFRAEPTLVSAGLSSLARHGRWLVLALLINIGWQVAFRAGLPILPGWGQRIGFAGLMIWMFWLGVGLHWHSRIRDQ